MDRSLQTVLLYVSVLYVLLFFKKSVTKGESIVDGNVIVTEKIESNWLIVLLIFILSLILITVYVVRLYWVEVKRFLKIPEPPEKAPVVPVADPEYVTASRLYNTMQENDKNYLMFGRSPQVSRMRTSDILKGDKDSSNIGETYGSFTGMSLYGGPDMYEATGVNWGGKSVSNAEAAKFIAAK